jgi:lipopolysaccharide heptosyltransferase I
LAASNEIMSDATGQRGGLRILIVRLGAVGDVIRTLPLLHALRAAQPDAAIGWAVEEPSSALLAAMPALDAVHVVRRREISTNLRKPWRWAAAARIVRDLGAELRHGRYELILEVHGTMKAALVATMAGGRVVGFERGGSKECAHLLHDVSHPFTALPVTRVRRALMLGAMERLLGPDAPVGTDDDPRVDFGLRSLAPSPAIDRLLGADARPLVVLFPFASADGQAKRWPIGCHVELGSRLAEAGTRVILAWGSRREGDEARDAVGQTRGIEVAPPTSLVELCALLRGATLAITGDTGPMHLAAAVGTRVLALFGPTDPAVNRPWGPGHEVIVHRPLAELGIATVQSAALAMLKSQARMVRGPAASP